MQYDVFISHSSRDKDEVALPLAEGLQSRGLKVWLDKEQLHIGDSIRRGLDNAIKESRFGVVILSPAYLDSEWGQKELDAFFAKEKYQKKSILPIYHGVEVEDVEQLWPMLADKISLRSEEGIDLLVDKIQHSIQRGSSNTQSKDLFKKKRNWWPDNNWQWLIALGITGVLGALPFIIDPESKTLDNNDNRTVIYGDINHYYSEQITKSIGRSQLLELQDASEDTKAFESSLQNLEQAPSSELKEDIFRLLAEKKPQEASELWRADLVKREESNSENPKKLSEGWVDVGNIAYTFDPNKALEYYQKAIGLNSENIEALNRIGLTQHRLNNVDEAAKAYNRILELSEDENKPSRDIDISKAVAFGNLGLIFASRNQLNEAEDHYLEALSLDESTDRKSGVANQFNNLGVIYLTRKSFDKAEESFLTALKIDESLKRPAGIARAYSNLGSTYFQRNNEGDLELAKGLHLMALDINNANMWIDEVATNYGNLGLIYRTLGKPEDLKQAEKYYLDSLQIETKLGRVEGIAIDEGNLGLIYQARNDLGTACNHWRTSLGLYNKIDSEDAPKLQDLLKLHCQ